MQDMQDMFEKEVPYIVEKKRELRLLNNLWIKILCCFTIFVFIYTIKLINNEASRKLMVVIKEQYSSDYQNDVEEVLTLKLSGNAESVFRNKNAKIKQISVVLPVNGKIITYGKYENHPVNRYLISKPGVDIAVMMQSPVIACYDGKVTEVGYNRYYGNYVIMQHDEEVYSLYAFLDDIKVDVGTQCKRGNEIGAVKTGSYIPSKIVHFELWIQGKSVNPISMLGEGVGY
jgi:murein DD-endopeptidase MepM/ murein hydrolase activator NlpD